MKITLRTSLLVFVCWLSACGPASESKDQETAPDSLSTSGMSKAEIECFSHPDFICESGLNFVRLGDYVSDVRLSTLSEAQVQDSLENGNGYIWLVRTLHMPEGKIIVEGEFLDERFASDSLISASKVNRIRVESPMFRTPADLHVGSTLAQLLEKYDAASIQVFSLPEYESINIQVGAEHYLYLIRDKGNQIAQAEGNALTVSSIPQQSVIAAIVVM
ncbi:MAG: hypothetical protein R3C61_27435 [Bacteroidia bacterium]